MHGFIGHAIETRIQPQDAQQLPKLAFHFTRSGDRARGAAYAQQAADQAMRSFTPAEALTQYRAALDLLASADQRRGELLLSGGTGLVSPGRATALLQQTIEMVERNMAALQQG